MPPNIVADNSDRPAQPRSVLIVDDSRGMRLWLRSVLSSDPRLQVIAEAGDAVEARDFLRHHLVDVMTLDIEMPGMSGLEFLSRVMRSRPMPVVMMSGKTAAGSDAAVSALSRGAVDCMVKPNRGSGIGLAEEICERVYQAANTTLAYLRHFNHETRGNADNVAKKSNGWMGPCRRGAITLIGASTGGVAALETVLPSLRPDGPPVVIVQHMPNNFLKSFAERLDRQLHQKVCFASDGLTLGRGDIVLAPADGSHTEVFWRNGTWTCRRRANDSARLHCPAIDVLFCSAVDEAQMVSAAILTGLGNDGAEGLKQLATAGAKTFGQNEETCVVYGMPRAAQALGAVQQELPLDKIGAALARSHDRQVLQDPMIKPVAST